MLNTVIRSLLLGIVFCAACAAALKAAAPQFAYRITFTDKQGAPPLSSSPNWLSARSMARRAHLGISLDSTDRPVSPLYIDTALQLTNGVLHTTSRWLNNCVVLIEDSSTIQMLRDKPYVRSIEWIGYFTNGLHQRSTPLESEPQEKITSDSSYYGKAWLQTKFVNGEYLHNRGFTGAGKLIAVLDAGFVGIDVHSGLAKLRNEGRLLETYDFCKKAFDFDGNSDHGLGSVSLISGFDSGNYVGSAPDAQIAVYVTEDNSFSDSKYELDNLIAGMERADSIGADVLTVSLGYFVFGSPFYDSIKRADMDGHTTNEARATNLAVAKGIFCVISAGNLGSGWTGLCSPADADSALTIGSVDGKRKIVGSSGQGPNASGRTKPELCFLGSSPFIFFPPNRIATAFGTSVATPQAAGYAACLLQAFPDATLYQIRQAMIQSADSFASPSAQRGYGIPDFRKVFSKLAAGNQIAMPELYVHPNPFKNGFALKLPNPGTITESHLCDMLGRNVPLSTKRSDNELRFQPLCSLPPGVYILTMMINGESAAVRIVHE